MTQGTFRTFTGTEIFRPEHNTFLQYIVVVMMNKKNSIGGKVSIKGNSFFLLALKRFFFYWIQPATNCILSHDVKYETTHEDK